MSDAVSIRLFCSDLDGTLVGNPEASQRFKTAWEKIPARRRPVLVYSSGRLVDDLRRFYAQDKLLPPPDYAIGGVGTQIYDESKSALLEEFHAHLGEHWDLARVREVAAAFPGMRPQADEFQHEFKSSWFLDNATPQTIDDLRQRLADAGLGAEVVYSSARDLDVLPRNAAKGGALAWLCTRLSISLDRVLVAGDTGNDASMFLPGVRGIIVENAQPELLEATVNIPTFTSRSVMADGVLDGLRHFRVITHLPAASDSEIPNEEFESSFRMLFTGSRVGPLGDDEKRYLVTAYERAVDALKKNITPLGFSACSLGDNTVTGIDANYRSVWARDGSLTIIDTLGLDDEAIVACQRRTLETLLNATSPPGQIPANVRIEDSVPDYSGVGNIASIDSGLWVLIAAFRYFEKTHDFDFLHHYADPLQRVMNWLSAHDSNNDGLLEIPEAGDWTDLFGRSYNILYDEVLWFRANVCFGRILEYLGDTARAADYLRWSQRVRSRVLETFWPTTALVGGTDHRPHRFSDRQFDLGDTQYLLAEITPFSFNWRCDVLGNLLAFLFNLLDIPRARTTLRFMWGVGVNFPWPVANLYPVVQAGDPDWRPYYTVNLLNLPHHYHNGGIWPFIGGMWVRFLHRLGFHEIASRELVRLAQLNQLGRDQEWEFNEWAHGITGRPMGKAFQAWSAASFIRAAQEIEADPEHLT